MCVQTFLSLCWNCSQKALLDFRLHLLINFLQNSSTIYYLFNAYTAVYPAQHHLLWYHSIYHMVENWSSGGFKHNSWDNNLGMPSLTGFTKAVWSHFWLLKNQIFYHLNKFFYKVITFITSMTREFVYFKDNINIFEVNNLCWSSFR